MEKYKIASLVIITVIALLAISAVALYGYPTMTKGADNGNSSFSTPIPTIVQSKFEDTGGTRPLTAGERLEEQYQIDRSSYNIYLDKFYETFGSLPKIPDNFGTTVYLIYTGRKTDFNTLTKDYYLQPEFFPLFVKNGLKFYETYDPRYVGTYGWGTYPSEQWLQASAGAKGYIQFFFKTGWGIETRQGMNLKAVPTCNWIKATIQNPIFLTPPTYPVFCTEKNCGEDWARLITLDFEISENAKIGDECNIGVTTVAPPNALSQQWLDKYQTLYVAASASLVGVGTPFSGHIKVVE